MSVWNIMKLAIIFLVCLQMYMYMAVIRFIYTKYQYHKNSVVVIRKTSQCRLSSKDNDPLNIAKFRVCLFYKRCKRFHNYRHHLYPVSKKAMISDQFKLAIHSIPKTGSSSWRFAIWNNSLPSGSNLWRDPDIYGKLYMLDILSEFGIKRTSDYTLEEITKRLVNYYSVLSVRHPLSRLESAYTDKMSKSMYCKSYGNYIIKKYRRLRMSAVQSGELHNQSQCVTFSEFLRFLIDGYAYVNPHWKPYIGRNADVCATRYNYIAKTETANDDLKYIILHHMQGRMITYQRNQLRKNEDNIDLPLFNRLPKPQIYIDMLMKYYWKDMHVFGYTYRFNNRTVMASCEQYTQGKCV